MKGEIFAVAANDPTFALAATVCPAAAVRRLRNLVGEEDYRVLVAAPELLHSFLADSSSTDIGPSRVESHTAGSEGVTGPSSSNAPASNSAGGDGSDTIIDKLTSVFGKSPIYALSDSRSTPSGTATVLVEETNVVAPPLFSETVTLSPTRSVNGGPQFAWGAEEAQAANSGFSLHQLANTTLDLSGLNTPFGNVGDDLTVRLLTQFFPPGVQPSTSDYADLRFLLAPEARFYARDPEDLGSFLEDYIQNRPDGHQRYSPYLRQGLASFDIPTAALSAYSAPDDYSAQLISVPRTLSLFAPTTPSTTAGNFRFDARSA